MKKLIGVTPRLLTEDNTEKEFVNSSYLDFIRARGANVIMLTLDNPCIEDVLSLCDGFVITGGSDVDPIHFNEENLGLSKGVKPRLDALDKKVVEYGVKNKIPMLGICRGHQALAVFMGGSLHQDIGTDHTGKKFDHEVKTVKNRMFDFNETIITNSYHHQAIKQLAPNTTAICYHLDGTNEAFIHDELPIIGIQWHPEKISDTPESKLIFDKFFEFIEK